MNVNPETGLSDLDRNLREIRRRLEPGGPVVNVAVLAAYVNAEHDPGEEPILSTDERATVRQWIARYRDWYDAYCEITATLSQTELFNQTHETHGTDMLATGEGRGDVASRLPSDADLVVLPAAERRTKTAWYLVGALAASLLLGLGLKWFVLDRGIASSPEVLLAQAQLQHVIRRTDEPELKVLSGVRGTYQVLRDYEITITSPRDGFLTVVLLREGASKIYPSPDQVAPQVRASVPFNFGPLAAPDAPTAVLVIVTEKPATDLIKKMIPANGAPPTDVDKLLEDICHELWKSGHRWIVAYPCIVAPVASH